ncbi:hypothetical protein L9F63_003802 [Diploptera punctata]|uniref:C-type lectin domain-containing protein n=1 Tax=Diploptera punctata TaxID=6984 RepID=A0AAD7ZK45_DIPPU|nr:hypothetical protein L9F63_003802 [Diploptera punctata]
MHLFMYFDIQRFILSLCVLQIVKGYDVPNFQFTLESRQNESGQWFSNMQLQHSDSHPWDVDLEHKTVVWKGVRSILINAKIVAPLPGQSCYKPDFRKQEGYVLLPDYGYYKLYTDKKTWADAAQTCQQEGAHLLILNSDEEAHKVSQLLDIPSLIGNDCWIGIHDMFKAGHYVTLFNEPLSSLGFTKWDNGEPGNRYRQNCLDFTYVSNRRYGLGLYNCHYTDEFICEKELC